MCVELACCGIGLNLPLDSICDSTRRLRQDRVGRPPDVEAHPGRADVVAVGDDVRVDVGNVYRILRALEEEGIVRSEWSADLPGPAKRTYEITDEGRRALERWTQWLREARDRINTLIARLDEGR